MQAHVYVLGAGVMGTDIATAFLGAGHDVTLVESNMQAAEGAQGRIQGRWADKPLPAAFDVSSVDDCYPQENSIVIEAITESLEAKRQLLKHISERSGPTVTLFSNTSTLSILDLSAFVVLPERFAGLHFFFPAHRNPFIEIITARHTSDATVATASHLARELNKHSVICRDRPGFVVNAFYLPLVNESVRLVDEKIGSPSEIDFVAKQVFGVRVGPLAVARMMSPETTRLTIEALVDQSACPPMAVSIADGSASKFEITDIEPLSDLLREEQIRNRLLAAVFVPTLRMLESGDVSAAEIDIAATRALQFSHPPVELMKQMGQANVGHMVGQLSAEWGGSIPATATKS